MNVTYFSVFDKKSGVYGAMFPAPSHGAAERLITDAVNTPSETNMLSKFPEDFALYAVVLFDDSNGVVVGEPAPIFIVEAQTLVR